jgi:hypothetical protein
MKKIQKEQFVRLLKAYPVCILSHHEVVRINVKVEPPLVAQFCDLVSHEVIYEISDPVEGSSPFPAEASGDKVYLPMANGNLEYLSFFQTVEAEGDPRVRGVICKDDG